MSFSTGRRGFLLLLSAGFDSADNRQELCQGIIAGSLVGLWALHRAADIGAAHAILEGEMLCCLRLTLGVGESEITLCCIVNHQGVTGQ